MDKHKIIHDMFGYILVKLDSVLSSDISNNLYPSLRDDLNGVNKVVVQITYSLPYWIKDI